MREIGRIGPIGRIGLIILVAAALAVAAEAGRIRGRITDAKTGEPLIGASVIVDGTSLGGATDANGEYFVANVPVGTQTLSASYISYQSQQKTGVLVILDQTVTEDFRLSTGRIEVGPIIIKSTRPNIVRTGSSSGNVMDAEEISKLPVQSLADIVKMQTGIVTSPAYGQHLRGGRPDEVMYFVDGVATSDPLYGYQAARVNPEATAEVVVISGGFDAEYGEAMSGIIQVITKEGKDVTQGRLGYTTDELFPGGLNFGDNRYELSLGGPMPGLKKLRYFVSGELYFTDDYNPMQYKLKHQERQDYKGTVKLTYALPLNEGMRITANGFIAREQYGLYPYTRDDENHLGFKYNLDHFVSRRERVKKADLSVNHMLTKSTFYTVRLGYFGDNRNQSVRDLEREATERNYSVRFWEDYIFKAEDTVLKNDSVLFHPMPGYVEQSKSNTNNPWGVYNLFYGAGDYRGFLAHWADVLTAKGDITHNVGKVHEFKVGLEVRQNYLSRRYNSLPWDPNPFVDSYNMHPVNAAMFVQDRMDFEDLVVRAGLRFDYLDPAAWKRADPTNIEDTSLIAAKQKYKLSPRLGVSFPITTRTKFRFSYGHFFQTPSYRYLFDNITSAAYARGNQIIGNPDLLAQQTIAYELGLEQELSQLVVADLTAYYKDIFDLMGTRFTPAVPMGYFPLVNEEYGSVRGFEVGVQKTLSNFWNARASYGLSLARGTASSTYEWYNERYRYGVDPITGLELEPPRRDYALEFDERHNAKLSLGCDFPGDVAFIPVRDFSGSVMFSYGSGLPYTPREVRKLNAGRQTAERNSARMPPRFNADLNAAKSIKLGGLRFGLNVIVTNLFNNQTVQWVYGYTGLPNDDGYITTYSPANWILDPDVTLLNTSKYNAVRDHNHDGYITDAEEYTAYKMGYLDFVDNPANYGSPRQIKLGVTLEF
jgi:outer membrane receptor for ferrienterochelin and colicin